MSQVRGNYWIRNGQEAFIRFTLYTSSLDREWVRKLALSKYIQTDRDFSWLFFFNRTIIIIFNLTII